MTAISLLLPKLLTLCILFSATVLLGISPLTSLILALRAVLVAKLVILGISPLTSFTSTLSEALVATLVI